MSNFNKMTVKALKAMCKEMKLKKYSKLKKAQLINLLTFTTELYSGVAKEDLTIPDPEVVIIEGKLIVETKEQTPGLVIDTTDACLLNIKVIQKQTTRVLHRHKIGQSVFNFNEEQTPEAPLPSNLSHSPMTPVASPIEEKEDEVLSDLDDFIGDYDENLKKAQEEKEAEQQRMKTEMLEKLEQIKKEEEAKIINELTDKLVNDVINQSTQELKTVKPKQKSVKKQLKRSVRKIKKQPKQLDLSTISIEDLIAEATKRGYRMSKIQKLNTTQMNILANTVDDLDMLSDDEE